MCYILRQCIVDLNLKVFDFRVIVNMKKCERVRKSVKKCKLVICEQTNKSEDSKFDKIKKHMGSHRQPKQKLNL